jgi:signal transduction histidine kinase
MDPEPLIVGALRRAGLASLLLVPLVHRDQTLGLLATVWCTALETVQHLAPGASVEMRALLVELRDTALQSEGLAGALEQHVAVVRHQSGLAVDLEVAPDLRVPARHAQVL